MEIFELEGCGEEVRREAGIVDPWEICKPSELARRSDVLLERIPNYRLEASYGRNGDRWLIAYRASLPEEYLEHRIGHELGHINLRRARYLSEDVEACCDFIGSALLMPRLPFIASANDSIELLARRFSTTQTSVVLRIGETTGRPVAVITPKTVRARGDATFPHESVIRRWRRSPPPGFLVVPLTDRSSSVALMAA